jgi:glycosyltransferase involved in cell wall biosynthesis
MLTSVDKTCPKEVDINLIDAASTDETLRGLRSFCNTITDRKVRICESTYRGGLAETWNLGMMLTDNRYVIFVSSDCLFLRSGWFESFQAAVNRGGKYILMENHAVFCLDKQIIPVIGWFDEAYEGGPHFDPDYMIRASEQGIHWTSVPNKEFYLHGNDPIDIIKGRLVRDIPDRLPMHGFHNEEVFKAKWQSGWPGWKQAIQDGLTAMPHPPTHINQVKRMRPEIDAHPLYTQKCR